MNQPLMLPEFSTMTELSLFSGIGGFTLGLGMTGHFSPLLFCEQDTFCQKVLRKHWAHVPIVSDVYDLSATKLLRDYRIQRGTVDLITAGFPCQPFSIAGNQQGSQDERHLWGELARVIGEVRPRYLLLENVPALTYVEGGAIFRGILRSLAALGYHAEWDIIPASTLGARHRRERWFLVGYTDGGRHGTPSIREGSCDLTRHSQAEQCPSIAGTPESTGAVLVNSAFQGLESGVLESRDGTEHPHATHSGDVLYPSGGGFQAAGEIQRENLARSNQSTHDVKPLLGRTTHGVSQGLDYHRWDVSPPNEPQEPWEAPRTAAGVKNRAARLKALGNAVFPPIIAVLGQRIWERRTGQREFVMG